MFNAIYKYIHGCLFSACMYSQCKFKNLYIQYVSISNSFNGVCYKFVNAILQLTLLGIYTVSFFCDYVVLFYNSGFHLMWYAVDTCICNP